MQRRVLLMFCILVGAPTLAHCNVIVPSNTAMIANTTGWLVPLSITGTDFYTDMDFSATIEPGGPVVTAIFGKQTNGAIPAANLAGTIWAGGAGGAVSFGLNPTAGFLTQGLLTPKNTSGTFVQLTFDATGVVPDLYHMSLANTHLWNGVDPDSSDPIPVPLDTPDALLDLRNLAPASFASAPSVGSTLSFGAVAASTPATLDNAVVMSETDGGTIVLQTAAITGSNAELFQVVGGFSPTRYDIDSEQPAYDLQFLGAPAPGTYTAELRFSMRDTYFNALPDATYTLTAVVVPEPSSMALAAIALAAVASLAWRRRIT